ncbi:DNA-binding protein [Candidatus Saccharibacteria bacterium]|nr:MAG: DNA-binding protein [Candidatus Saccharibacteria bacterium]
MQTFFHDPTGLIVLKRGESLVDKLVEVAKTRQLKSAWANIIGGASSVTLGFYSLGARDYKWQTLDEELEITGLQGNLVYLEGDPFWHLHGTFSRGDYSVIGGHVKDLIVGLTAEILLMPMEESLARAYDEETGLKLICRL